MEVWKFLLIMFTVFLALNDMFETIRFCAYYKYKGWETPDEML
jgi:hypothetical protein